MLAMNVLKAQASDSPICSKEEAYKAEIEATTVKDWEELYKSFKKYGHCDDGAIGEGYSDSVGRLLSNKWNSTISLTKIIHYSPKFRTFVIKHIDETIPLDTLKIIFKNAKEKCPDECTDICNEIIKATGIDESAK